MTSLRRSLLAICLCLALLVSMVFHRANLHDVERQVVKSVSATMWKVSELVFEAQRFKTAMADYGAGRIDVPELQLRFDILWSRMDVVAALEFQRKPRIADPLDAMVSWRTLWDSTLFGDVAIGRDDVNQMRRSLEPLIVDLRRGWVGEFADADFGTWAQAASTTTEEIARQEWMIAGLLALIIVYLVGEVYMSSASTQRERALRTAADRANRSKSDFIANVSHEIRTPLNGIINMAAHLLNDSVTREQRDCLAVIEDAGDLLLSTINDVLDLSKLETGTYEVEVSVFDPMRGLRLVHELYSDAAKGKGLALKMELPRGPLPKLEGDDRRVRQVLHNLVGNAVKFTDAGHVLIKVWYEVGDKAGLHLHVVDTGPGISLKAQKHIFEPFAQEMDRLQRGSRGTGLGLPIARALCIAMNGSLTLTSAPGQGSSFRVFLPLNRVEATSSDRDTRSAQPPDTQSLGLRVLITDDNATNRFVLRKLLAHHGVDILEASNGVQALELVAENRFDVVLMDIQMPGMDGMEATTRILEAEALAGRTPPPVICITANALPEQAAQYEAAGMTAVLSKPVSKDQLVTTIKSVTSDARGARVSDDPPDRHRDAG